MRRILPLLAAASVCLLALPASASAVLYGVESNAELVNSNRSEEQRAQTLTGMRQMGAQVVRINVGWNELAERCGGQSPAQLRDHENPCYEWGPFDQVVSLAAARNMQVLASVSRAPGWLHRSSNSAFLGNSNTQWLRSVAHYSAMMRAASTRYRTGSPIGRVRMWTVWNEPNSDRYLAPQRTLFQQRRTAGRYAQLLAHTSVQIKAADRFALVAAGPTGPTGGQHGMAPITFLSIVQSNLSRYLPGTGTSERRWVDAWAHNPYPGFTTAPSRGFIRAPKVGMSNIRDLFRQLDRSPITRGKPVWATEFSWETNPPDRILGIPLMRQARYMAEAFDWLDQTGRVPVAIWYGYRDGDQLSDWQSGTLFNNGRKKPSWFWYQRPISVPFDRVRRGTAVRVWARSAVRPGATKIAWSYDGRTWRVLPVTGRRRDGSQVQTVRVSRTMYFATFDGVRGPARIVRVG